MNPDARLAAIEADLQAIKHRLGMTAPGRATPLAPALDPGPASSTATASAGLAKAGPLPHSEPSLRPPVITRRISKEVALGGYWVTRIGALLVLLAAIFLAAYLSVYSNPVIRVSELVITAGAALGVAYWQQRRGNLRFALVLHSLGDALLFLAAFAAYAFEPTRVIATLPSAIAVQTLAGAAVFGHALHRRSEGSAAFALILLTWVAGFSLDYQQSTLTLAYVLAIATIAAALAGVYEWTLPLAYAAVASPVLAAVLADQIPLLRTALQLTLAALPVLLTLPFTLGRKPLASRERTVCFLAFGACLGAALFLRYALSFPSEPYGHPLLAEAGAFAIIALLFRLHAAGEGTVRFGLACQALCGAALSGVLYLYTRYTKDAWTGLAILAVGAVLAWVLRQRQRWVSGYAYLAFCLLAQIWAIAMSPAHVRFGSERYAAAVAGLMTSYLLLELALGRRSSRERFGIIVGVALLALGHFAHSLAEPAAAILTLIALGVAAAALTGSLATSPAWALAALLMAHVAVVGSAKPDSSGAWLVSLVLLTAADAVILVMAKPFRHPAITPLSVAVTVCMLGALYSGFARAQLGFSATFAWVPLAAATFVLGFIQQNPSYRVAALAAFGACLIRLFATDLNSAFTRIVAFFLVGLILLGVGYLYSRLSRTPRVPIDSAA
jgi:hypothetical protein